MGQQAAWVFLALASLFLSQSYWEIGGSLSLEVSIGLVPLGQRFHPVWEGLWSLEVLVEVEFLGQWVAQVFFALVSLCLFQSDLKIEGP